MKIISKFLFTWLTFFAIWLAFTTSLATDELIVGAGVSLLLTVLFASSFTLHGISFFTPKRFIYILRYILVFSFELLKSNLKVAKIVLSPKMNINPGIVKFKTNLKSDMAKMLLANSITLTPGTLTVDVVDDIFYIHWLNVESVDMEEDYKYIAETFETILRGIYS